MAGYVDNIIDSASYPVEPVFIPSGTISGKVISGIRRKIGIDAALMITKNSANLTRPRLLNYKVSCSGSWDFTTISIEKSWTDSEER